MVPSTDLPSRDHRGRCLPSTCGFTRAYTEQHSGVKRISRASSGSGSNVERGVVSIRGFYACQVPRYRRYPIILAPFKRPLPFPCCMSASLLLPFFLSFFLSFLLCKAASSNFEICAADIPNNALPKWNSRWSLSLSLSISRLLNIHGVSPIAP